jgi:oligopeptide/dipeptide ABC transporter ATP-binding protein
VSIPLLEYKNLKISFRTEEGWVTAVDGISFTIEKGKTMGLVGESGCGKSVTSLASLNLLPSSAKIEGEVLYNGKNLLKLTESEWCSIRGNKIAMIFQEPMTALNPAFTIGDQLSESFITHQKLSVVEAKASSIEMLKKVGIPSPEARFDEYPHQLSGGMRQRVMIAMALACKPDLLIADEPTTALDVTIQAQILELMRDLQKELGMSMLFITHDLGVVAELCDDVTVMYAGKIVERSPVRELYKNPTHPYSIGLLASRLTLQKLRTEPLSTIPGTVPQIGQWQKGCRFAGRCSLKESACLESDPSLIPFGKNHFVACRVKERHLLRNADLTNSSGQESVRPV